METSSQNQQENSGSHSLFSEHQGTYFAYWLTQSTNQQNRISQTVASSRVDMNPHQVEAACFALKSPLEKGVLLADEVGLGKTIEASLVIAQKWAEQKRNILLVVPASLRKQWSQELQDKFELPSIIIDSNIAKGLKKKGLSNPLQHVDKIVIVSYEYLARQKHLSQLICWNLVVFDEAHKLRNLYQKRGNQRAKDIVAATVTAESRILLSATPIQNNLMELYGLSKVIDEHYFGDEKSFRLAYANRRQDKTALEDLKQRIQPLCHRTLRRQVQQEGGINFTRRYSMTQDFTPAEDEWRLYQDFSDYLRDTSTLAIAPQARQLVCMGLRKILASSSFAISGTLEHMIKRLTMEQTEAIDERVLTDLEEADDWLDQDFSSNDSDDLTDPSSTLDTNAQTKAKKLTVEIERLQDFQQLATNITTNAKGDALLAVLQQAMDFTENLGGQRKAVVFTESCRTQQYLQKLLEANGYRGQTVLLNGTNNDPNSKAVHQRWKKRHQGSARISGSKTADMKAAIVEHFQSDQASVLISTEAGGEGINLQFCSVLVNYDLPWNPQKVEQRIGRVHRYGQKNDVVVVNFVNRKNPADQRVFQLLNEKLNLFEGVFGASDEILGAISNSIDIEKRIFEIYQKCRSDEAIETEFNRLQEDMKSILEIREETARLSLLNHFDRDVVTTLKTRRDESNDFLREYEQVLLDLAKAELPDADINRNHFNHLGKRYDLSWTQAQENSSEFFRLQANEHYLAWDLVRQAKQRQLTLARLKFQYDQMEGQYADLKPWIGQHGILQVINIVFHYNKGKSVENHLLVLAQTDAGHRLSLQTAAHLMRVPATTTTATTTAPSQAVHQQYFAEWTAQVLEEKTLQTEQQLDQYLEQESTKLERWAEDKRAALMQTAKELDEQIASCRKENRQLASTTEKIKAKKALRKLERQRDDALTEYHQAKKQIEQQEDELLDEVSEKLALTSEVTILFTLEWELG
ncbi:MULTISPECIES: SNF2-related protein [unclassified Oceanobacter]|uniref:SNF2-related protein n=2 Tax=Gammaproteobacteria TaxID=1236 RepID=UPI00273562D1|nr:MULTISPECIES: SNF2-related protein [unclassified Oceanobacter]MDP2610474.1 SNF2-related protein [Oceanobacter sp. 1_MG-2023]MDP2613744.1 SNF2-related protein [Oceanobacter sp. 2_MG-2023]